LLFFASLARFFATVAVKILTAKYAKEIAEFAEKNLDAKQRRAASVLG
jgi:hypothetical protein